MASGNFKMGVSGIGDFKNAMNEARTATKTLEAEMKLAQTQFKATGDAETYLQQRTQILANQISQQQKAADAARSALETMKTSGVDPASAAYQQMERSLYDAERQLVLLRQEADKTGDELLDTSTDADKLKTSLDDIGKASRFTAIATGFQAVANIVQTVWSNVQRIGRTIADSADWADDLITQSKRYGLSTEELQRYQYASRFVDTEVDTILKARDKLMQKTKGEGILFLSDGMTQYAIELQNAEGQARDSMDVFWDLIDTLREYKNETERDAVAQEYFGKSFRDLNTLVEAGRSGWEKYMADADVVDDSSIEKLGQLDDALERLDSKWTTLKNTTLAGFAPAIESALDGVLKYINNILVGWDSLNRAFGGEGILPRTYTQTDFIKNITGEGAPAKGAYDPGALAAEVGAESAMETVNAFAAGTAESAEAAYAAGAALGAAAAAGFAAAAAGAGGSTTNNNTTQNFGNTYNYYNNGYEAYNEQQQRQLAGYGG